MLEKNSDFKKKVIGIIGGRGAMGSWFERYFRKKGFRVLVSDVKTELTNVELACKSDIIILSTPMDISPGIAVEIGGYISKDKLLMDFCSLKEEIVNVMLENTDCEVLGCHPVFGQYTKSLNGHNIVFCPGRKGQWYLDNLRKIFEDDNAVVSVISSKKHDEYMAVVQGLTHILTIAAGKFFMDSDIDINEILKFSTPVFRINAALTGRLFGLDLSLYKDLVGKNKKTEEITKRFISSLEKSLEVFTGENNEEKILFLDEIMEFIGNYRFKALSETNSLFSHLYSL